MNKSTIIFSLLISLSALFSQVARYESSSIKGEFYDNSEISIFPVGELLDIPLENESIIINESIYFESLIKLREELTVRLKLNYQNLPIGSKFFLIDLDDNDVIGPFYTSGLSIDLGPIHTSNFVLQCITPIEEYQQLYNISLHEIIDLSSSESNLEKRYYKHAKNNRENPVIVVTGFWPPTNEMIRHFSQDLALNPNGWEGENWQDLGYDIISFFPEFDDPDCSSCGQGYGDFEVDYQDTSYDFWTIIDEINPTAIITFSRGYIDNSWELEFNYYNRTDWYADYTSPFFPTPNPPDSDEATNFLRNSTLPMEEIMSSINESNLNLNSYIDYNGDPGHFVSEFMGYHGVWYHNLYQFDSENPCYLAGHVHVGGLIDWEISRQATEITITKLIEALEEYVYIPGDTNNDENIDILDIITTISYILGNQNLEGASFYAADMNSDGIINIQDIILIINLIL